MNALSSKPPLRCVGPIRRRAFFEFGGLSVLGLGMADFLRAQEVAKTSGGRLNDKAVIFIWLPGGPPHMETYDMKPDAPREYRGIFQPIHTNVSGMDVCELLPSAPISTRSSAVYIMTSAITVAGTSDS